MADIPEHLLKKAAERRAALEAQKSRRRSPPDGCAPSTTATRSPPGCSARPQRAVGRRYRRRRSPLRRLPPRGACRSRARRATPSASSPSSRPARSRTSRPPRPTRSTPGPTCSSASSSPRSRARRSCSCSRPWSTRRCSVPPTSTARPNPSKAPWYFLGLQELLTMLHPMVAGVTIPDGDHRGARRGRLHRQEPVEQARRPQVRHRPDDDVPHDLSPSSRSSDRSSAARASTSSSRGARASTTSSTYRPDDEYLHHRHPRCCRPRRPRRAVRGDGGRSARPQCGHLASARGAQVRQGQPAATALGGALSGRDVERNAVLERRGADVVPVAGRRRPAVAAFVPPDAETLAVTRRQFLNRGAATLMGLGLATFGGVGPGVHLAAARLRLRRQDHRRQASRKSSSKIHDRQDAVLRRRSPHLGGALSRRTLSRTPRRRTRAECSKAWKRASSRSTRSACTSAAGCRGAVRPSGSSALATVRSTTASVRRSRWARAPRPRPLRRLCQQRQPGDRHRQGHAGPADRHQHHRSASGRPALRMSSVVLAATQQKLGGCVCRRPRPRMGGVPVPVGQEERRTTPATRPPPPPTAGRTSTTKRWKGAASRTRRRAPSRLLLVVVFGMPIYWLKEPGRQTDAVKGFDEARRAPRLRAVPARRLRRPRRQHRPLRLRWLPRHRGRRRRHPVHPRPTRRHRYAGQVGRAARSTPCSPASPRTRSTTIITYGRANTPMPAWGVIGGGPMNEQQVTDLIAYIK